MIRKVLALCNFEEVGIVVPMLLKKLYFLKYPSWNLIIKSFCKIDFTIEDDFRGF